MDKAPVAPLVAWYVAQPEIVQQAVLIAPLVVAAVVIPLCLLSAPSLGAVLLPWELNWLLSLGSWRPGRAPAWLRRLHIDWDDPPLDPPATGKQDAEHSVDTVARKHGARGRFGRK